jgi:selenocysteine lyase/cysteine desulfurase
MYHRTPETGAGIVSFRKPELDAVEIVATLSSRGIAAAPRAGWVRTSPPFYNDAAEIDRMLEELP